MVEKLHEKSVSRDIIAVVFSVSLIFGMAGISSPFQALEQETYASTQPQGQKLEFEPDCSEEKKRDQMGKSRWLYNKGPWSFAYDLINGLGLVLYDLKAGKQHIQDSITIPQFGIKYLDSTGALKSKIVRFCDAEGNSGTTTFTDKSSGLAAQAVPSITSNPVSGIDNLRWTYAMRFNETGNNIGDSLVGTLVIHYDIVIRWKAVDNCEASGIECYRLIPKVTFEWVDSSNRMPTLNMFTAMYRLDYPQPTAIYPIKDADNIRGTVSGVGAQESLLTKEQLIHAVKKTGTTTVDNIHSVNRLYQVIGIPGCTPYPYECVHMHWRWGAPAPVFDHLPALKHLPALDPMVEPSTDAKIGPRGKPYLVPGQSIDIAIVRDNPTEDVFPDDPTSKVNGEEIAQTPDGYKATGAVSPIVWYMSSVENKKTDTFFRHGIFVLNP